MRAVVRVLFATACLIVMAVSMFATQVWALDVQPGSPQLLLQTAENSKSAETSAVDPEQASRSKQPALPGPRRMHLLIVSSILAVDQANKTGNYSVLRGLAAPDFQAGNSAKKLTEIFKPIRDRNLDLSPIILFPPKLVRDPKIDINGMLRLSGFFDTRPDLVIFDLLLQEIEGNWRLFGISLDVQPPKVAGADNRQGSQNPNSSPAGDVKPKQ